MRHNQWYNVKADEAALPQLNKSIRAGKQADSYATGTGRAISEAGGLSTAATTTTRGCTQPTQSRCAIRQFIHLIEQRSAFTDIPLCHPLPLPRPLPLLPLLRCRLQEANMLHQCWHDAQLRFQGPCVRNERPQVLGVLFVTGKAQEEVPADLLK